MNETQIRDGRRGQLLGIVWLRDWQAKGRGKATAGEKRPFATWIPAFEAAEKPEFVWIWCEPYLTTDTDVDEYRGQRAGAVLLARFSGEELPGSKYFFDRAKADAGRDEWLFVPQVMEADGWRRTDAGGWTKKAPR